MTKWFYISLIIFFCLFVGETKAENAPVTKAGLVVNAPVSPSVTSVPITVSNFWDIGSFTLTLDYSTTVLTYVSATPNPAFTGLTVSVNPPGRIQITWPASGFGVTLPDQAVLITLKFYYIDNGTLDTINWFDNGSSCRYTRFSGGSYVALNDLPTSAYYVDGVVTNHPSPVVIAPSVTGVTTGAVALPVKVAGFSNIGSLYLNLEYDPDVLTYQGYILNPLIQGTFLVGNTGSSGGKMKIIMSWFGDAFSLADSSILITLNFNYSNISGFSNYSELIWLDNGPSCEFADGQYRTLYDIPTAQYFRNGLITSQICPQTWLTMSTDAQPSNPLVFPVNTSSFINIRSFTITFEYDPAVLTYGSFVPNAAFSGMLNVSDLASGTKRKLAISWSGPSSLTLPDGSSIVGLNFTFNTGTTELKWLTEDASSCRYNDSAGNAYYTYPKNSYFHNGLVSNHTAPILAAWYASPANGQQFTVPVLAYHFTQIGSFSFTLDYDPGVLTYQGAALIPNIGGAFSSSSPGPGRLVMSWSGPSASLAESSELIHLTFVKNDGSTSLAWYDNGISCNSAETISGPPLYDQPQSHHYINGYIGSTPLVANFITDNTLPQTGTPVAFTDISTGGPASWHWEISPSTFVFVNGTNASCKNPVVKFTETGAYTISLMIYLGSAAGIKFMPAYIHTGIPGLWTGITSGSWAVQSNWHNYMVPVNVTDVIIPSSAPNWPEFNGNLTLGGQCNNLTLNGPSQLTISGNLSINSGKSLIVNGPGTLLVRGN